jgi:hypothetical protein
LMSAFDLPAEDNTISYLKIIFWPNLCLGALF